VSKKRCEKRRYASRQEAEAAIGGMGRRFIGLGSSEDELADLARRLQEQLAK
jgi:hypothetical protein